METRLLARAVCFNQSVDFEQIISSLTRDTAGAHSVEAREEVAEIAEAELVSVSLSDRLRLLEGREVRVTSAFGQSVSGRVIRVTPAWVLIAGSEGEELVSTPAIALAQGLNGAAPEASMLDKRLGINHILRELLRERRRIMLRVGTQSLSGYIAAVLLDHIEVATETGIVSVALAHLFSVRLLNQW